MPDIGSQPNIKPKTIINMRPNQNDGIAWPTMAIPVTQRSTHVPSRTAASMPYGSAIVSASPSPTIANVRVTGMRPRIRDATLSLKK